MLIQNVADKVDRPKKNDFQPVFLSADEMQKMFKSTQGNKVAASRIGSGFLRIPSWRGVGTVMGRYQL